MIKELNREKTKKIILKTNKCDVKINMEKTNIMSALDKNVKFDLRATDNCEGIFG